MHRQLRARGGFWISPGLPNRRTVSENLAPRPGALTAPVRAGATHAASALASALTRPLFDATKLPTGDDGNE